MGTKSTPFTKYSALKKFHSKTSREETYSPDKLVYVTDKSQTNHFRDVFAGLHALGRGDIAEKCVHISFGQLLGVSTRSGTGAALNDVMNEAIKYQLKQEGLAVNTGKGGGMFSRKITANSIFFGRKILRW